MPSSVWLPLPGKGENPDMEKPGTWWSGIFLRFSAAEEGIERPGDGLVGHRGQSSATCKWLRRMRNLRQRPRLWKAPLHKVPARGNSAGSADLRAQGIIPVPVGQQEPRRKIVPAREHSRLTVRKENRPTPRRSSAVSKCANGRSKDEGESRCALILSLGHLPTSRIVTHCVSWLQRLRVSCTSPTLVYKTPPMRF